MDRRRWLKRAGSLMIGGWCGLRRGSPARAYQEAGRFDEAIAKFEEMDRLHPPPAEPIVFVGSSTIRLWDLKACFPDLAALNRGFGGSTLPDVLHYQKRVVNRYGPSVVVLYAGDNDIAQGRTAEDVEGDFRRFLDCLREDAPKAHLVWLAIKPSRARWRLYGKMSEANRRVAAVVETDCRSRSLDLGPRMLGGDGEPRPELFREDGLHLSEEGYRLWSEELGRCLREIRSAG